MSADDEEELPLNLSTKNRQIWSPGSACEREKIDVGAESPLSRWEGQDDIDAPLELVKRCRSNPDEAERPASEEPRRCPSAPAHQNYPIKPPQTADLNFSLLLKNENRNEKSFQVRIKNRCRKILNSLEYWWIQIALSLNKFRITVQFPFKML